VSKPAETAGPSPNSAAFELATELTAGLPAIAEGKRAPEEVSKKGTVSAGRPVAGGTGVAGVVAVGRLAAGGCAGAPAVGAGAFLGAAEEGGCGEGGCGALPDTAGVGPRGGGNGGKS